MWYVAGRLSASAFAESVVVADQSLAAIDSVHHADMPIAVVLVLAEPEMLVLQLLAASSVVLPPVLLLLSSQYH